MALYKHAHNLRPLNHPAFEALCEPLSRTQWSGIYRCDQCGLEIVSITGSPLPADDHHHHRPDDRSIKWRLLVAQEGQSGKL